MLGSFFLIYKISVIINILIWICIKIFDKKRYKKVEDIITNACLPVTMIYILIGITIFVPIINNISTISEIINLFNTNNKL